MLQTSSVPAEGSEELLQHLVSADDSGESFQQPSAAPMPLPAAPPPAPPCVTATSPVVVTALSGPASSEPRSAHRYRQLSRPLAGHPCSKDKFSIHLSSDSFNTICGYKYRLCIFPFLAFHCEVFFSCASLALPACFSLIMDTNLFPLACC